LLVTEAGGLVGNFTGESDFLHRKECLAANPKIYAQLVGVVGKYSQFASAGDKAALRQGLPTADEATQLTPEDALAAALNKPATGDAPF
jgi:myo-inositol-1(or 4)-monophosphatase